MKIICSDPPYLFPEYVEQLKSLGVFVYEEFPKDKEELIKRCKEAEVLIVDPMTKMYFPDVLSQCPDLTAIITTSIGTDHIDVNYCKESNIKVINFPGYNAVSVAEHTFTLLLSLVRQLVPYSDKVRSGVWNNSGYKTFDLNGKVLGIMGAGSIAREIARIAVNGFNMKVNSFTRNPNSERAKDLGINKFLSLEELLKTSDIIVAALPHTNETNHILNSQNIATLRPSAIIVNVGRGGVIDTEALADALLSKKIAGAALDVIENEPFDLNNASDKIKSMFKLENVIITPHLAGSSHDANINLNKQLIEVVKKLLN